MRALCAGLLLISGCSYPDFGFSADAVADQGAVDDGAHDGESGLDTAADTADTFVVDAREASTDASDTSVVDSGKSDSAMPDTAKGDVGAEVVAAGCASGTHFLCDEFDTTTKVTDLWDGAGTLGGGTTSYETALSVTPPRSFVARIVDTSATQALADLIKTYTVSATSVTSRLEADVYLEAANHPRELDILKVETADGTGKGLGVIATPTGYAVETIGTSYVLHPLSKPLPVGKWFHLRLDVVLQQVDGSFSLSVDGAVIASAAGISTLAADSTTRTLALGIYAGATPITAFAVRFDNVSLDNF